MLKQAERHPTHSRLAIDIVMLNDRLTRGLRTPSQIAKGLAVLRPSWVGSIGQFKDQPVTLFTPRVRVSDASELSETMYTFGKGWRSGVFAVTGTLSPELSVADVELVATEYAPIYEGPSIVVEVSDGARTWQLPVAEPYSGVYRLNAAYAKLAQQPPL